MTIVPSDDDELGRDEEILGELFTWWPELGLELPAPPEGAPSEVGDRIVAMNTAYTAGHCDECLVYGTVTERTRPDGTSYLVANMDHLQGCPLHPDAVRALAAAHGIDFLPGC